MKKFTSIFLALVLSIGVLSAMPFTAKAETEVYGDYEYRLLDDNTIEIKSYIGTGTTPEIPANIGGKTVTSIGENAFWGRDTIISVLIPEGITSIGQGAFYACGSLHSVILPESLKTVGNAAFSYMGLEGNITIPAAVTSLGESPFWWTGLENIFVDERNNFYKDIDGVLFDKAGEILIKYPVNQSGKSYVIPDGVKNIASWAFLFSDNLTEIIFPGSLTNVSGEAFFGCAFLKNIIIPATIKNIGFHAYGYTHHHDKIDGVKIYCYENSAAHQYAIDNEINYELLICTEHKDVNGDAKCDNCNADIVTKTCGCCSKHNHGNKLFDKLLCFICRIINLINSLFGIKN